MFSSGFQTWSFLKRLGAELLYGDLLIPSTLPLTLKGVQVVIDVSTLRSTSNYTAESVNGRDKLALIEAAKLGGVKHLISFSVLNAAKNSSIPLLDLKIKIEKLV